MSALSRTRAGRRAVAVVPAHRRGRTTPAQIDRFQPAPSPSGKAEVCKTSIPGSNPGGASNLRSGSMRRLPTIASRSDATVGLPPLQSYGWQAKTTSRICVPAVRYAWQKLRHRDASNSRSSASIRIQRRKCGCTVGRMRLAKRFVYVLRNNDDPPRYYTGLTSSVAARLRLHNQGLCRHTATRRPWRADVIVEFADEQRAVAFEKYLKSGSGVAFANRHLR